jgi:hypothetical protein
MSGKEHAVHPLIVRVFAAPAAENACENTWENATRTMAEKIRHRYGEKVRFAFVPLFSGEFFSHPAVMQALQDGSASPPIIMIENEIVQSGGKLSERLIRQEIEGRGLTETGPGGMEK